MSLILKDANAILYHFPRTGGTWMHKALINAGVTVESKVISNGGHESYHEIPAENMFSMAFIREPISWYTSYWTYRNETGWEDYWWIDFNCKAATIDKFAENILKNGTPYLTEMYRRYLGFPYFYLNFVGRFSHLEDDMVNILKKLRVKFNEKKFRNTPLVHYSKNKPTMSNELQKKLLFLEKETLYLFKKERV